MEKELYAILYEKESGVCEYIIGTGDIRDRANRISEIANDIKDKKKIIWTGFKPSDNQIEFLDTVAHNSFNRKDLINKLNELEKEKNSK